MRLYRFTGTNIDVVLVTDGSDNQKKIFVTESPRGIIVPGQVLAENEQDMGKALLALGFYWIAGIETVHEDIIAFAKSKNLGLVQIQEGITTVLTELNTIV